MEAEPVLSFCIRSLHPDVTEQKIRSLLTNVFNISSIDFVNKNTRPRNQKKNPQSHSYFTIYPRILDTTVK